MSEAAQQRRKMLIRTGVMLGVFAGLHGCSTPPPPPRKSVTAFPLSNAKTEREYRVDVARHLYQRNAQRIYSGKLPPLLYAIGVTRLHVSPQGEVLDVDWMRRPKHAPEVIAEIERTIREAAPLPVAPALHHLYYTDTWLWHASGRFQLDTLTEGQA